MGLLIGSFGCVNSYSKKQCRALFWWLKAAVKKAVKKNGGKKRFKFQYDPSSYALNFDDGRCNLDAFKHGNTNTNTNILQESHLILWVCVLWVEEPWEWYLFVFVGLFCTFSLPNFMSLLLLPIKPIKQSIPLLNALLGTFVQASELLFLSSLALEFVVGILGDINKTTFSKIGHSLEITCTNLVAFMPQSTTSKRASDVWNRGKEQQTNCKKVASNK